MGRSLISPSFSARLLLFRAFGEGKGVVVHYSTTHSSSSQVSPQSSVSINTTFSKNTHPSAGWLGLFSSAVCRHQWALEACSGQREKGSLRAAAATRVSSEALCAWPHRWHDVKLFRHSRRSV